MKEASFSLAEAKFTSGDINHMVLQNVNKAQLKVRSKKDNVAGIIEMFYFGWRVVKWTPFHLMWSELNSSKYFLLWQVCCYQCLRVIKMDLTVSIHHCGWKVVKRRMNFKTFLKLKIKSALHVWSIDLNFLINEMG